MRLTRLKRGKLQSRPSVSMTTWKIGANVYKILLANSARKDLDKLRGKLWQRIRESISELSITPRLHGCTKLRGGENLYRLQISDYRVLYDIDDDNQSITVLRVKHRRDVYRRR